jgi:hypothetical protein
MRATKLIHKIKKMSYPNILKKLKLPTVKYRRLRGDMIETFRVVHGIYDKLTSIKFEFSHMHLTHSMQDNSFKSDFRLTSNHHQSSPSLSFISDHGFID